MCVDQSKYDLQDDIKKHLNKNGMTKKHFSRLIGVSQGMLSHYLAKRVAFSNETLDKIRNIVFTDI